MRKLLLFMRRRISIHGSISRQFDFNYSALIFLRTKPLWRVFLWKCRRYFGSTFYMGFDTFLDTCCLFLVGSNKRFFCSNRMDQLQLRIQWRHTTNRRKINQWFPKKPPRPRSTVECLPRQLQPAGTSQVQCNNHLNQIITSNREVHRARSKDTCNNPLLGLTPIHTVCLVRGATDPDYHQDPDISK